VPAPGRDRPSVHCPRRLEFACLGRGAPLSPVTIMSTYSWGSCFFLGPHAADRIFRCSPVVFRWNRSIPPCFPRQLSSPLHIFRGKSAVKTHRKPAKWPKNPVSERKIRYSELLSSSLFLNVCRTPVRLCHGGNFSWTSQKLLKRERRPSHGHVTRRPALRLPRRQSFGSWKIRLLVRASDVPRRPAKLHP